MDSMVSCPVCGKRMFTWNMPDGPFGEKICPPCLHWSLKIEKEHEERNVL